MINESTMSKIHLGKVKTASIQTDKTSETSTTFHSSQVSQLSIITQFYPPDYAATGQLIAELATQLQSLGMRVKVFTGQPGYAFQNSKAPQK